MKKVILQGAVLAISFVAVWLMLSQVDFMSAFDVEKNTDDTEQKLGEIFWESIEKTEDVVRNDSVQRYVQRIVDRICDANDIDAKEIKLHIINKNEINAFAMPGDHLVVYSGLINDCKNESELAGVLGHEIAHLQKKHVMKKLAREIGFSVLVSISAGGGGSSAVKDAARFLSNSAYDRALETEADFTSVDYLLEADIDPAPFADLLYRMANAEIPKQLFWVSSHPESEARAKDVLSRIKGRKPTQRKILAAAEWDYLKKHSE